MNENEKEVEEKRLNLSLKSLFLDPNNYRFRDSEAYTFVADNNVTSTDVQRRTQGLVSGKNNENLKDLLDSFKKNGFLPVDQIQVRRIDNTGKYLVVEGNRRVAALKFLQSRYEMDGLSLGNLKPEIFTKVPVVFYNDATESHHLILMGLKHISGNKKWPAINQAELIRTLHEHHGNTIPEICQSIGISQNEVVATLNTLALIDLYKSGLYGDQFQSEKYSIFREIIRNLKLRNWLGWDDQERKPKHKENLDKIFSWISEEYILDDDDEDQFIGAGQKKEPILVKSAQIRDLAKIIDDPQAINNLDITRNLSEATLSSEVLSKDKVKNAISIINQEVSAIFNMSRHISNADRYEIKELNEKFSSLLNISQGQELTSNSRTSYINQTSETKFTKIKINNFRHIENLELKNLRRINIIAGLNNTGKTSILEAVKLICTLNDTKEFTNTIKRRAKLSKEELDIKWFLDQIPKINISAEFNEKKISLNIEKYTQLPDDLTYYIDSIEFTVSTNDDNFKSLVHFYEKYPQKTEGPITQLCQSIFSSPFNVLEPELLSECYSKSLNEGSKETIIDFIKEHVDLDIKNIELDKQERYRVIHAKIIPPPDLTLFGEGLQRIFKMGLLFAGAKNGVLVIDEFENAIHASLLPKLTKLIYELSKRFNVQVFITSHSKECIDAFAQDKFIPKTEISSYALIREEKIEAIHIPGEKLNSLIEKIDFDLRGKK